MSSKPDYPSQQAMIKALLRSAHAHRRTGESVRLLETHISWVLLAGRYAYKIKKALNLGFLDFTAPEARRHYCEEEIRLNRRLAPQLYLDVVAIGGTPDAPVFGVEPAIEYAVRMCRFDTAKELDHLLEHGRLMPQHVDRLAAVVAEFHESLPRTDSASPFGTQQAIHAAAMQNFVQLRSLLTKESDLDAVGRLAEAAGRSMEGLGKHFESRHAHGFVRECHGDLHLGNIVLVGDEPVPFDGIEFNPVFRWIDIMDEVAFLMMDLLHRRHADLAFRFLNAWLEQTGDYGGVRGLRFYLAYRATVRAKICAIRASQPDQPQAMRERELADCREYLLLADACLAQMHPALIITHGLPGSGKSTFAQAALERLGAIRIRSDVERKRQFGLRALESSRSGAGGGIYGAEATERTYARLQELARGIIESGFTVIVDAAFLKREEREQFRRLAQELGVPFAIAAMQAAPAELGARVVRRQAEGGDASEAGLSVLRMLQRKQQPLTRGERTVAVTFRTGAASVDAPGKSWERLARLLAFSETS